MHVIRLGLYAPPRGPDHVLRLAISKLAEMSLINPPRLAALLWDADGASLAVTNGRERCRAQIAAAVRALHAEHAVLILLAENAPSTDDLLRVVAGVAAHAHVQDAIVVARGRWRSVLCKDVTCCPPAGRPLPSGLDNTRPPAVPLGTSMPAQASLPT